MTTNDNKQPAIFAKMHAIQSEIGSIGKNNKNSFQNYAFRSVGQAMAALQPLLNKHGVILQPTYSEPHIIEQEKGAGATVLLRLQFVAIEDGSAMLVAAVGQGADSGDKAVYKAMAGAFKYAVFQTFCIPEDGVDAEFSEPEVKTKKRTPANGSLREILG